MCDIEKETVLILRKLFEKQSIKIFFSETFPIDYNKYVVKQALKITFVGVSFVCLNISKQITVKEKV